MTNEELEKSISDLKKELADIKPKKKDKWDKVGVIVSRPDLFSFEKRKSIS